MNLNEKVRELAEQSLPDQHHFIVEVKVTGKGRSQKILVIADGDNGIDIDGCSHISRTLGDLLDKTNLFDDAYNLEVSSPGADEPITLSRQYKKNLGRKLSVLTADGISVEGKLDAVTETSITLFKAVPKKKKSTEPELFTFTFEEIKKAHVVIDFNALKQAEENDPLPQGTEEEEEELTGE